MSAGCPRRGPGERQDSTDEEEEEESLVALIFSCRIQKLGTGAQVVLHPTKHR